MSTELNTTQLTAPQKFAFRFKKDKLGNKRQPVELQLEVPTIAGVVEILKAGGKQLDLLNDALYATIKSVAADIVADKLDISQENFPFEKVTWEAIANMERAERATIAAEQWEAFASDYMAVMPGLTGKTTEQVTLAVQIYLKKFAPAKTNKQILTKLKEQLALYMETPNAENFSDVMELLLRRADAYLSAEDIVLTADAI